LGCVAGRFDLLNRHHQSSLSVKFGVRRGHIRTAQNMYFAAN
jgi:hypothetical protein